MSYSPACQRILAEMLSAPVHSTDQAIAAYVSVHTPAQGADLLLQVILDDAPEDSMSARRLWPLLNAEVRS